jgi:hypothetical protein
LGKGGNQAVTPREVKGLWTNPRREFRYEQARMSHGLCERKVFVGIDAIEPSATNSAGFAKRRFQGGAVCCSINAARQARND